MVIARQGPRSESDHGPNQWNLHTKHGLQTHGPVSLYFNGLYGDLEGSYYIIHYGNGFMRVMSLHELRDLMPLLSEEEESVVVANIKHRHNAMKPGASNNQGEDLQMLKPSRIKDSLRIRTEWNSVGNCPHRSKVVHDM